MTTVLLATRSAHKAREVRDILAAARVRAVRLVSLDAAGLPWSAEEDGIERWDTFEENAAAKARYFARKSGMPAVADDSGLEVAFLNGRPGVRTKRFAPLAAYPGMDRDDANNAHLLSLMRGVPAPRRDAKYVCVAAVFVPESSGAAARPARQGGQSAGPAARCFRGEAPGRILPSPRGAGGFGYDPLFEDGASSRSFAELDPAAKNERSHRGKAFRALAAFLAKEGLDRPASA